MPHANASAPRLRSPLTAEQLYGLPEANLLAPLNAFSLPQLPRPSLSPPSAAAQSFQLQASEESAHPLRTPEAADAFSLTHGDQYDDVDLDLLQNPPPPDALYAEQPTPTEPPHSANPEPSSPPAQQQTNLPFPAPPEPPAFTEVAGGTYSDPLEHIPAAAPSPQKDQPHLPVPAAEAAVTASQPEPEPQPAVWGSTALRNTSATLLFAGTPVDAKKNDDNGDNVDARNDVDTELEQVTPEASHADEQDSKALHFSFADPRPDAAAFHPDYELDGGDGSPVSAPSGLVELRDGFLDHGHFEVGHHRQAELLKIGEMYSPDDVIGHHRQAALLKLGGVLADEIVVDRIASEEGVAMHDGFETPSVLDDGETHVAKAQDQRARAAAEHSMKTVHAADMFLVDGADGITADGMDEQAGQAQGSSSRVAEEATDAAPISWLQDQGGVDSVCKNVVMEACQATRPAAAQSLFTISNADREALRTMGSGVLGATEGPREVFRRRHMMGSGRKTKRVSKREAARAASAAEAAREQKIAMLAKTKQISDAELLKLKPKKQRRAARFEKPVPSRFCHVCSRTPKNVRLAVCCKIKEGTCRKVICEKCFAEYSYGDFDAALRTGSSDWTCPHCTGCCPTRAQCRTYQRINDRLRVNRLKQEKPRSGRGGKRSRRAEGIAGSSKRSKMLVPAADAADEVLHGAAVEVVPELYAGGGGGLLMMTEDEQREVLVMGELGNGGTGGGDAAVAGDGGAEADAFVNELLLGGCWGSGGDAVPSSEQSNTCA